MNQADPFGHFNPKPQQSRQTGRVTNFLEAFKENAGKKPAENLASGSFLEAFKKSASRRTDVVPTSGDLRPGEAIPSVTPSAWKRAGAGKNRPEPRKC